MEEFFAILWAKAQVLGGLGPILLWAGYGALGLATAVFVQLVVLVASPEKKEMGRPVVIWLLLLVAGSGICSSIYFGVPLPDQPSAQAARLLDGKWSLGNAGCEPPLVFSVNQKDGELVVSDAFSNAMTFKIKRVLADESRVDVTDEDGYPHFFVRGEDGLTGTDSQSNKDTYSRCD